LMDDGKKNTLSVAARLSLAIFDHYSSSTIHFVFLLSSSGLERKKYFKVVILAVHPGII
jgi:hypothetical protein